MAIRKVFFDLGDTLVEIKPEVYVDSAQRIAAETGRNIKADDLREAIKDEWCFRNGEDIRWVNTDETEVRYWRGFYRDVLKRLGVDTPSQSVLDLLVHRAADPDSFVCFDDVAEVLEALERRGIGIGLISNAFPSARRIIDKLGLSSRFWLVLSYEYTCAKLCPDIYRYALDRAGVRPEEALFVDDRLKFTEGAAKAGMQVKLVDRDGLFPSEQDKIYHLRELLAMIPEVASMNRAEEFLNINTGFMWAELISICLAVFRSLPGHSQTQLLNFWTYRGGGKTTFLHNLKTTLAAPDVAVMGLWDAAVAEVELVIQEILRAVETSSHIKKVVLLDNVDYWLRTDDAESFFEFERRLVLPLLERKDVLLITTSQIPLHQWREYDVRIHQENHLIRALNKEEVAHLAEPWSLDANWLFEQSLGYPQILCWLQQEPHLSEAELAQRITDHFLSDRSPAVRQLASIAALLPSFDVAVLRDVLPAEARETSEGLYAVYIDRIRELIAAGLVAWDMRMGAYHFPNSIVRYLLARSYEILHREDFVRIHEKAMAYYQAEARRAGYLQYALVSALYHTAYAQSAQPGVRVGESCRRWVQNNLSLWAGADWPTVLQSWQSGAADETVNKELQALLGVDVIAEITQMLTAAQHTMEEAQ